MMGVRLDIILWLDMMLRRHTGHVTTTSKVAQCVGDLLMYRGG